MRTLLLVVLTAGCVVQTYPNTVHRAADLRTEVGACSNAMAGDVLVRACAATGSPFMLSDDGKTPLLWSYFRGPDFLGTDPGNWQVEIFAPDGALLLKERPAHSVANVADCSQYGCYKTNVESLHLPSPWGRGLYRMRYTSALDTRIVAELTMRLID